MRTAKFELTNTVMEATYYDFKVNEKPIGSHLADLLADGKFKGTITVTIKETETIKEEVSEGDE